MAKNVKLLLTESVEALGIVGDVVNVRVGYARNFLLPRNMATVPTDDAIKAVAAKRAEAERQLALLRKEREALIGRMNGIEITIQRSCNDLGHLYASVTQQEIATALAAAGYSGVKPRDVRLNQNIKRVDTYDVHIKFEADLEATIKLWVVADRKLDLDKKEDVEIDNEGNLVEKKADEGKKDKPDAAAADADEGGGGGADKADKPKKKAKKDAAPAAAAAAPAEEKKKSTWGTAVDKGPTDMFPARRERRKG